MLWISKYLSCRIIKINTFSTFLLSSSMILEEGFAFGCFLFKAPHPSTFTSTVHSGYEEGDHSLTSLDTLQVHQMKLRINKNLSFSFLLDSFRFALSFPPLFFIFYNRTGRDIYFHLNWKIKYTGFDFINTTEEITRTTFYHNLLVSMNLKPFSLWS